MGHAAPVHIPAGLGRTLCGVKITFRTAWTGNEAAATCPRCKAAAKSA